MKQTILLWLAFLLVGAFAQAQNVSVFADGFATPIGMEADADGNIWLTQVGTGNDDGKVSILAPDGTVNDVVTGLPSAFNAATGEIVGAWRTYEMPDSRLLVVSGEGAHEYSGTLLTYDLTGFTPGDTPLDLLDFEAAFNVDDFVLATGAPNSNPYSVAWNPGGEMYIVDAGGNFLLRRDMVTDDLSVFAAFPDFPNPTPVGPPVINSVPTKVVSDGADGFYVCNLTGFPFLAGTAGVHHVAADGTITEFAAGQTLLVDLAIDPTDGEMAALQFAEFELGPVGFLPGSAKVVKIFSDGTSEVMAEGFGPASGLTFDAEGSAYVSSIFTGEIIKIEFAPPANDDLCDAAPVTVGGGCAGIPNIVPGLATAQPAEPIQSCVAFGAYDTLAYNSVWFSFVAPAGQVHILAAADEPTISSAYVMSLFSLNGDCADLTNLELIECSVPQQNLFSSPGILTTLTEGETYYVQVSGRTTVFDGLTYSATGCLTVTEVSPPANDNVCDAIALELNADPQVFSNLGATSQLGEFPLSPPPGTGPLAVENDGWALGTNFIDNSVWFTFTTPAEGGNVSIDLLGSLGLPGNFNTQLAVYSATDCNDFGTFSLIGASDNYLPLGGGFLGVNSRLDLFCLDGNTIYYVLVDGGASFLFQPIENQGYFSINVESPDAIPLSLRSLLEAPDCPGGENGTVIVAAEGGAGEYIYAWDTGDSTQSLTNALPAGAYTLTVTDRCGEELVEVFEIPSSLTDPLSVEAGADQSGCEDTQVQLNASHTGGLPMDTKRLFFQKSADFPNYRVVASRLDLPEAQDTLGTFQDMQLSEMEFVGDDLFGVHAGKLFSINTASGEMTVVDSLAVPGVVDLSYLPSEDKLYCVTSEGDVFEVDPATANVTLVVSTGLNSIHQAAIDDSGTMYAVTFDAVLYSVDLSVGTPVEIGPFSIAPIPLRGLEIDPADDRLYATASTTLAFGTNITWQATTEVDKATGELGTTYRDFSAIGPSLAFAIKGRSVAPIEYMWEPAAALDDATIPNPNFVIDQTTVFTVNVTDHCGPVQDDMTIELLPNTEETLDTIVYIGDTYNGIVINGDTTILETFVAPNGCDGLLTINITAEPNSTFETWPGDAISIRPNPASSILTLNTIGIEEMDVEIIVRDIYGRIFRNMERQASVMELPISELNDGIYFLEIKSDKKMAVRRFVKQ